MFEVFIQVVVLDDLVFNFIFEVHSSVYVLAIISRLQDTSFEDCLHICMITMKVRASLEHRSKPTKYPGISLDSGKDDAGSWLCRCRRF